MSQTVNAAPRRSAGLASNPTRRPQDIALHSAGFAPRGSASVRRVGATAAAGLVALGVAVPAQAAAPVQETTAAPATRSVTQAAAPAAAQTPAASAAEEQVASPVSKRGTRYTTTALNVRTKATTSSARVATLKRGAKVTTTGRTSKGWVQISYKGKNRWVSGKYLTSKASSAKSSSKATAASSSSKRGTRYTTTALNVRSKAGTSAARVGSLGKGAKVTTTGRTSSGWVQISYKGKNRWVSGKFLTNKAPAKSSAKSSSKASSSSSKSAKRQIIVNAAKRGVGTGYVYGGTAFGRWDCSGFTRWVYSQAGIKLPRVSHQQAAALTRTSNPQPGDLVLQRNRGHVGIYIGNGQMISALNSRQGTKQHPVSWMKVDGYYTFK